MVHYVSQENVMFTTEMSNISFNLNVYGILTIKINFKTELFYWNATTGTLWQKLIQSSILWYTISHNLFFYCFVPY